jgi:hypothetical protein
MIFFCTVMLTASACKRQITHEKVESTLKATMENYLNTVRKIDTNKLKFKVIDVVFYEDKTVYDCRFNVDMKENGKDTVGTMEAWISKDFVTVRRKF